MTPRTRLIALSAVSWFDGKVFPWQELREATGVPVLVDGAQSAGAIDVDATEADFYTVSAQKWLCGPDSTGALYVRDPEQLPPRLVGYPARPRTTSPRGRGSRSRERRASTPVFPPPSSSAGLEAALSGLPAGRFARAAELTAYCRAALVDAGHDVVTEAGQATLVSFRHPATLQRRRPRSTQRGVILRDLPGTDLLRASVGWWNDETDLDRLVAELARALSRVGLRAQPELARDRLQRRDHVRDVLVEVELEQLGALVDVVARDTRRERRLLQLLLDRLRLEPLEAGRPDEPARMDEA